jgi:hypothetical protein
MTTCRNRPIRSDVGDTGLEFGTGAVLSKALVETVTDSCGKKVSAARQVSPIAR